MRKRIKRSNDNGYLKKDIGEIIVDMNDIKSIMREFIMNKIEGDMEEIVRKYLDDKVIEDNNKTF